MSRRAQDGGMVSLAISALLFFGFSQIFSEEFYAPGHYVFLGVACFLTVFFVARAYHAFQMWLVSHHLANPVGIHGNLDRLNQFNPIEIGLTYDPELGGRPYGALHGVPRPKLIFDDSKGHFLAVCSTGGGKTSSLMLQSCLQAARHSNLVTTAKGIDVAIATYRTLTALGHNVICIDPFRLLTKHGLPSHDFNPMGNFAELAGRSDPNLIIEAQDFALQLRQELSQGGENEIFRKVARSITQSLIVYLAILEAMSGKPVCNPAELYRILHLPPDAFKDYLYGMSLCPDYDGYVRNSAKVLIGKLERTAKSMESFLTEAQEAVKIYNPAGHLGRNSLKSNFDFKDLKRPGKPIAIHIIIPPEKADLVSEWAGLVLHVFITHCIEANSYFPRVKIEADEFENISQGELVSVIRTLKIGRSRGVDIAAYVQDLGGLRAKYPKNFTAFLTQFASTLVWNVKNPEDSELWSKRAGQKAIVSENISLGDPSDDYSVNLKEEAVPYLRPDEIMNLPKFTALLVREQTSALIDLVHYNSVEPWKTQIDPVPGAPKEPALKTRFDLKINSGSMARLKVRVSALRAHLTINIAVRLTGLSNKVKALFHGLRQHLGL